jgi:hypothetical protein
MTSVLVWATVVGLILRVVRITDDIERGTVGFRAAEPHQPPPLFCSE